MYEITLKNEYGDEMAFNQIGGAYTITDIVGLSPVKATINTNTSALIDGGTFNSAKVNMRTINMAFVIETDAETNRLNAYKVLRPKKPITMYYKSDLLDVYIEGYVQSVDVAHFAVKQTVTVAILCPAPFFQSAQEMIDELSVVIDGFHFPFASTEDPEIVFGIIDLTNRVAVVNNGNVDTGLIFEIYAEHPVSNPTIYDYTTQEYIGVDIDMQARDVITIDTRIGHKTVTLLREGVETNIFNSLIEGVTWLQLASNYSVYAYTIDSGDLTDVTINITHRDLYEGV